MKRSGAGFALAQVIGGGIMFAKSEETGVKAGAVVSDRLEFKRGGGALIALGLPFVLFGLAAAGASLSGSFMAAGSSIGDGMIGFVVGMVFVFFGGALSLGRAGTIVDRRRGELIRWWGLIRPLRTRPAARGPLRKGRCDGRPWSTAGESPHYRDAVRVPARRPRSPAGSPRVCRRVGSATCRATSRRRRFRRRRPRPSRDKGSLLGTARAWSGSRPARRERPAPGRCPRRGAARASRLSGKPAQQI